MTHAKIHMTEQVEKLLAAQNWLNVQYDCPEWRTKDHGFLDYVSVEAHELMEHEGSLFHYKKVEPNWPQVKLELVDILHFGLSHMIVIGASVDQIVHVWTNTTNGPKRSVPAYAKELALGALTGRFELWVYRKLVEACGFTLQEIFDHYLNKYTLNRFRIDNGQVRGEYTKIWSDGREDNEHLVELAGQARDHDHLYQLLGERYAA